MPPPGELEGPNSRKAEAETPAAGSTPIGGVLRAGAWAAVLGGVAMRSSMPGEVRRRDSSHHPLRWQCSATPETGFSALWHPDRGRPRDATGHCRLRARQRAGAGLSCAGVPSTHRHSAPERSRRPPATRHRRCQFTSRAVAAPRSGDVIRGGMQCENHRPAVEELPARSPVPVTEPGKEWDVGDS